MEQIHLIGHSRGGEIAETLIFRQRERGEDNIRSILRVAPTTVPRWLDPEDERFDPTYHPYLDTSHPDLPFGIILPEYDGDVCTLDGQIVFDDIFAAAQNQSFGNAVYLRGANHNFFNRAFEQDDRYWAGSLACGQEDQSTWLSREEQEDFLMRYAAAFLAAVTGQRELWSAFNAREPQPATMFGFAVTSSTYTPGMLPWIAPPSEDLTVSTNGSAQVSFYVQSFPAQAVGHGLFNHPGVLGRQDGRLPLYAITWDARNDTVTFPVLMENIAQADAISLFVAVVSSDARNPVRGEQAFTVVLVDADGAEQSVLVPAGTSALVAHPGEAQEIYDFPDIWLGNTPLGEVRIPLSHFNALDLNAVVELRIRFDQTNAGAVMLSGAYLV